MGEGGSRGGGDNLEAQNMTGVAVRVRGECVREWCAYGRDAAENQV